MKRLVEPEEPLYESMFMPISMLISGGCLVVITMIMTIPVFLVDLVAWGAILIGGIALCVNKKKNDEMEYTYQIKLDTYYEQMRELKKEDQKYAAMAFAECSLCHEERKKIDALLEKAYSANVIPNKYRDMYATVYLYDWFSTSMATDMDMALNMFVLEEIKDRLDTIIKMLNKSLLNQRIIIENQEKSIKQQEQWHKQMCDKLDKMQVTAEENTRYLAMIEANTATVSYFAYADYIRKL
ncbi:MAG: hypothetical protein J6Q53_08240 [Oscillospiraceae bacterium]|nr:hypothetical protein [Oscillospiraceae bacterium]